MKLLFFGLGSIGKRHARLIKENYDHEIYAFRSGREAKENELGIKEIYDLNRIDDIKPDVAFITNPTCAHMKYATLCAKKGIDLFIEKPLSNDLEGMDRFIKAVKQNGVNVYLGYCLRFHPAIKWLKEHINNRRAPPLHVRVNASSFLPDWRPEIDNLKHYSAFEAKGGGVLLEHSHEIDYLYYIFGDITDVKINSQKVGNVTADVADFCDALLRFDSGTYGNLHMNFMSRLSRREIIVDFKDSTVIADLIANKVIITDAKASKTINFDIEKDDIYKEQLDYFFKNIANAENMNGIQEYIKVFNIIMRMRDASR